MLKKPQKLNTKSVDVQTPYITDDLKPFHCEATFRRDGSDWTDFEECATIEEARRWCSKQRQFRGFYKAYINDVVSEVY